MLRDGRVLRDGVRALDEGELPDELVPEDLPGDLHLLEAARRHLDVEFWRHHQPRLLVLNPREQLTADAEGGGHDAGAVPAVSSLRHHLHGQIHGDVASQRGRRPELLVVAAPGVEAADEVRLADAGAEFVHVVREIARPGLFAALEKHNDSRAAHHARRAARMRGTVGAGDEGFAGDAAHHGRPCAWMALIEVMAQ